MNGTSIVRLDVKSGVGGLDIITRNRNVTGGKLTSDEGVAELSITIDHELRTNN